MSSTDDTTKKITADPLPYIIVFAVMVIISLVAITWTLDVWYKATQCVLDPNVWCSNNWTCNNTCPTTGQYNECFTVTGGTGLALCLMGPDSAQGQLCFNIPNDDTVSCECTPEMQAAPNCFSSCARNFESVGQSGSDSCCCTPGTKGCKNTDPTCGGNQ